MPLQKNIPGNYIVNYERLYNYYLLGKYDEVLKAEKFMLNHKFANERTYQLVGNSYDYSGNKAKAIKTYKNGIKRFPDSGRLYLELGTMYFMNKEYDKALENYNRGILVDPNFASNYYRAAQLYISSDKAKVWGLVYAESAILLDPSNEARHAELAALIVDCLKENIKTDFGTENKLSVSLVPERGMNIDKATKTVYLSFPGIYEGALMQPLMKLVVENTPFTCSLSQLIDIRKGLVENYFSVTDGLYGKSMYLLEFQKAIIDAGHWEAYNYFLFMASFQEEFEKWYTSDRDKLHRFIDWFNNDPFTLGHGKSVDSMQIFDSYRPVNMFEAIHIQAQLAVKGPTQEE